MADKEKTDKAKSEKPPKQDKAPKQEKAESGPQLTAGQDQLAHAIDPGADDRCRVVGEDAGQGRQVAGGVAHRPDQLADRGLPRGARQLVCPQPQRRDSVAPDRLQHARPLRFRWPATYGSARRLVKAGRPHESAIGCTAFGNSPIGGNPDHCYKLAKPRRMDNIWTRITSRRC